jgi:hypothetical protein
VPAWVLDVLDDELLVRVVPPVELPATLLEEVTLPVELALPWLRVVVVVVVVVPPKPPLVAGGGAEISWGVTLQPVAANWTTAAVNTIRTNVRMGFPLSAVNIY